MLELIRSKSHVLYSVFYLIYLFEIKIAHIAHSVLKHTILIINKKSTFTQETKKYQDTKRKMITLKPRTTTITHREKEREKERERERNSGWWLGLGLGLG